MNINCEEEPGAHGNSFTVDLLARGPAMVMHPDQEHLILDFALDQAAQQGMPPETLQ